MKLKKMFIVSSPVVPASRLHFKKCFSENAVIINVILKNATKFLWFFLLIALLTILFLLWLFLQWRFFYYVFWVKSLYQYVLNLGDRWSMFCTFSKLTFVKRYHHILSLDLISSLLSQNCLRFVKFTSTCWTNTMKYLHTIHHWDWQLQSGY